MTRIMNTRLDLALARAVGAVAVEPRAVGSLAAHAVLSLDDIVLAVVRRHVGLEANVHALVGGHTLAARRVHDGGRCRRAIARGGVARAAVHEAA